MKKRICLECSQPLKGRADQKFCSDACRNAHNNKKTGRSSNYIRKVNRTLKKNNSILRQLNPNGKNIIYKEKLDKEGFKFNYFTNICKTPGGRVYYFCYDEGFRLLRKNKYLLIHKENCM
jgi:hypothetical protein